MISHSPNSRKEPGFVTRELEEAWRKWLASMDNTHNHADYMVGDQSLQSHMATCMTAARGIIQNALSLINRDDFQPKRVLDIGCSIGLKTVAAQERFHEADVIGIDPDKHALAVARRVAQVLNGASVRKRPSYHQGVGEALPYDDDSMDLVLSTTVIEHVKDVDRCLQEIVRVLRPGGYFYIEAPNYLWPFEPHLNVVIPPLCPKPLLRVLARLQGRGGRIGFIEHLQFVHPFWIERRFRAGGLVWENGFRTKLERVLAGDSAGVQSYRVLARVLKVFGSSRLGLRLCRALMKTGIYPSLIYMAQKPPSRGAEYPVKAEAQVREGALDLERARHRSL